MLRVRGWKWFPSAILSWDRHLWTQPLTDALQEVGTIFLLCAFGDPQIILSAQRLFACLFSMSMVVPLRLYLSQAHLPLKLQSLSPRGCKTHEETPLVFPSSGFGVVLRLVPLPVNSSHFLSLPLTALTIKFTPKLHLCTYYLFECGFFAPPVVQFILSVLRSISLVFRMIWWYPVVLEGGNKPRVLLLCHHLSSSCIQC